MAIELIDKIKQKNGKSYKLVDAEDVDLHDGRDLSKLTPLVKTKAEYEAMKEAGTLDEEQVYFILQDEEDGDEP